MSKTGHTSRKMTAKELLERYAKGERNFRRVNLQEAPIGKFRRRRLLAFEELCDADFADATLRRTAMTGSNLTQVQFSGANLRSSELICANLLRSNLTRADLTWASLEGADLTGADFTGAILRNADLRSALLRETCLDGADLTDVKVGGRMPADSGFTWDAPVGPGRIVCFSSYTTIAKTDLGPLIGADLDHRGPILVDWYSVAYSIHVPGLREFLVRTGMHKRTATHLIDSLRAIDSEELFSILQSVFISYGGPDKAFAEKLQKVLRHKGVRTWFAPDDAVPGEKWHREMRVGVGGHDRMILVCSRQSLNRAGVRNEIELALEREAREGGTSILLPVDLDRYVHKKRTKFAIECPDMRDAILARVVADFADESNFTRESKKLLKALRNPSDQ